MTKFFNSLPLWSTYRWFMTTLGRNYGQKEVLKEISAPNDTNVQLSVNLDFNEKDQNATTAGNAYRNGCVLLAVMSCFAVYMAIIPYAFELNEYSISLIGYTEIILFVGMYFLVRSLREIKKNWEELRSSAENERRKTLEFLKVNPSSELELNALTSRYEWLIYEQVIYNRDKAIIYEKIEKASSRLNWFAFISAFAAALSHMYFHKEWLVLITAGFPVAVASMHALNSFLRINDLVSEHEEAYHHLINIYFTYKDKLESSIVKAANELFQTLANTDEDWSNKTKKIKLEP